MSTDNRWQELLDAAREVGLHGSHNGPCDNEGLYGEACSLHVEASERRHSRLAAAVTAIDRPPIPEEDLQGGYRQMSTDI